jgi:hypothetical protein
MRDKWVLIPIIVCDLLLGLVSCSECVGFVKQSGATVGGKRGDYLSQNCFVTFFLFHVGWCDCFSGAKYQKSIIE